MSDVVVGELRSGHSDAADLPVGIEVVKNTKGYNWTIKLKAASEDGLIDRIRVLDEQLRARFGSD